MGETYPITSVVYYNRAECCQFRANGMILELLDKNQQVIWSKTMTGDMVQTFKTAPNQFNI